MPVHISASRWSWLEKELDRWRAGGVIDDDTRARILGEYQVISAERRSLMALVVLAVLMCGIGLLLLIGYNWDRIPPNVKIGTILFAVAATFTGAAAAYARGRNTLGEALAFAGTLVFGNAIWLIAQVLHIRGHFPDAFFWFGIGALACGWLAASKWIGVEAVVLFAVWLLVESGFTPRPVYAYIPIWLLTVVLAYRLTSPVMLYTAALSSAVWVALATSDSSDAVVMPAAVVLAGCALFAVGRWRRGSESMQLAWRVGGLIVLLVAFVPLMVMEAQRSIHPGGSSTAALAIAAAIGAIAIAGAAIGPSSAADAGVAAVAGVVTIWAVAVWSGVLPEGATAARAGTVAFSALSLAMGLTLIRTALRSHRMVDLAFGVLFALAFLIVRWVSVIENMLWSGAFLLVTGGGLLLVARLWRGRRQTDLAAAGRLS